MIVPFVATMWGKMKMKIYHVFTGMQAIIIIGDCFQCYSCGVCQVLLSPPPTPPPTPHTHTFVDLDMLVLIC